MPGCAAGGPGWEGLGDITLPVAAEDLDTELRQPRGSRLAVLRRPCIPSARPRPASQACPPALPGEPPGWGGKGSPKPRTPYPQLSSGLRSRLKAFTHEDAYLTRIPEDPGRSPTKSPAPPPAGCGCGAGRGRLFPLRTFRLCISTAARGRARAGRRRGCRLPALLCVPRVQVPGSFCVLLRTYGASRVQDPGISRTLPPRCAV